MDGVPMTAGQIASKSPEPPNIPPNLQGTCVNDVDIINNSNPRLLVAFVEEFVKRAHTRLHAGQDEILF